MSGLERKGLGYRDTYRDGIAFEASRIRETGGVLRAWLTATFQGPAGPNQVLTTQEVNLLSSRSRTELGRYLATRLSQVTAGELHEFRMDELLETFYLAVITAHTTGAAFELVGGPDEPSAADRAMILQPIIWPGAPTSIFAPGGTGKSTLAAGVALSVQTGLEVIPGWIPELTCPVLVLDWEDDGSEWTRQLQAVARGVGAFPPPLIHYRRMAGSLADQLEVVAAMVTQYGIGLVIVDSVEAACGSGRESEGYNERANRLFDALRELRVASLLLDHMAGADLQRDGATPKPYGGVFKLNRSRAVFELRAERDPDAGRIEISVVDSKRNRRAKLPTQGLAMVMQDFEEGRARTIRYERCLVSAPELVRTLSQADQIATLLRAGAMTTAAVAETLGVSANQTRVVLTRMADKGRVQRLDGGLWGLAS